MEHGKTKGAGCRFPRLLKHTTCRKLLGRQTLDQCLQELVRRNIVSVTEARLRAQNKDAFAG